MDAQPPATADTPRTCGHDAFKLLEATLARPPALPRVQAGARSRPAARPSVDRPSILERCLRLGKEALSVVVAHDSPIVAQGLRVTLSRLEGITPVVRERGHRLPGPDADPELPQLVFADYRTAIEGARRSSPFSATLWACVTNRDRAAEIRLAIDAGVCAYILEDCALDDYLACVASVSRGERFLCARAQALLAEGERMESLSPRELAVIRLVVEGRDNRSIATELGIALGTVKAHVRGILAKLGARSRTQAASLAATRGLLCSDAGL